MLVRVYVFMVVLLSVCVFGRGTCLRFAGGEGDGAQHNQYSMSVELYGRGVLSAMMTSGCWIGVKGLGHLYVGVCHSGVCGVGLCHSSLAVCGGGVDCVSDVFLSMFGMCGGMWGELLHGEGVRGSNCGDTLSLSRYCPTGERGGGAGSKSRNSAEVGEG